jgi:hypothetical protein
MFCNAVGLLKSKIPNLKKNILTETEEGFQRHILLISLKIIIIKLFNSYTKNPISSGVFVIMTVCPNFSSDKTEPNV